MGCFGAWRFGRGLKRSPIACSTAPVRVYRCISGFKGFGRVLGTRRRIDKVQGLGLRV